MKAITVIQPWATLICDERKPIETRSWYTSHRGVLGIHAGKKVDRDACINFGYNPDTIPRGVMLCTVNLVDVVRFPSDKAPPDPYGDFTDGRFGWIMKNVNRFGTAIPVKGQLGLWNWDEGKQKRLF